MRRPLTKFEREKGYSPCPFFLGDSDCGLRSETVAASSRRTCDGSVEDCRWWNNLPRFGGRIVPGHPLSIMLTKSIPTVEVAFEEDE